MLKAHIKYNKTPRKPCHNNFNSTFYVSFHILLICEMANRSFYSAIIPRTIPLIYRYFIVFYLTSKDIFRHCILFSPKAAYFYTFHIHDIEFLRVMLYNSQMYQKNLLSIHALRQEPSDYPDLYNVY